MNRHDRRAANTNDSGLSLLEVEGIMKRNGVVLVWEDFRIMVNRDDLERTRERVARISPEGRAGMATVVTRALTENGEKIKADGFQKELTDVFYSDLMIWDALKAEGVVQ